VAEVVHGILKAQRPKLRYVVGGKARLILGLRRYIPGELFQNTYWSFVRRMVTKPRRPVTTLGTMEADPS
jgi:hypothetical protein